MRLLVVAITLSVASALPAQSPTGVRLINAPDAVSPHTLRSPTAVRQLTDGRVLVNDTQRRQLLVFDAALATESVLADSASGTARSYGARPGGIIPYLADSTLFVDPAGLSMLVVSPSATIARVASVPRAQDATAMGNNNATLPGLDASGRLVYRGLTRVKQDVNGGLTTAVFPDSLDIDRIDLATRRVDTVGYYKVAKVKMVITQTEHGMTVGGEFNPMQTVDDWAVLADGSLAIIRGQDYHVDIVRADGTVHQAPKVPFEWVLLTDEMKAAVLDSAKAQIARGNATGAMGAQMMEMHGGGGAPISHDTPAGAQAGASPPSIKMVSVNELPDYQPVFSAGAARADADGNVWVRTSATRKGVVSGLIYDVIDGNGRLVDRVQLQPGRQVVGFGPHGVVYLSARDDRGAWLERTKR